MKRVTFLVDGFNLYHSIRDIKYHLKVNAKWLNIHSLCKSYLYLFGNDAILEEVYYFSAIQYYLQSVNPDKISRHKTFIRCLKDTGVSVILGRFKNKEVWYKNQDCEVHLNKHEEKETDVSIAVKLLEIFHNNEADIVVIITGDTDLAPAVITSKKLFNSKKICFGFPYNRKNRELQKLATLPCFMIDGNQYINHQFANPYILKSGVSVPKPLTW